MNKLFKGIVVAVLMSAAFASNAKILDLYNFSTAEYDRVNTSSKLTVEEARNYIPPIDEIHQLYNKMIAKGMEPKVAMGQSLKVLNNAIKHAAKQAKIKAQEQKQ